MNERFASDLVFILVVLIVAAFLGFLIGFYCRRIRRERFQKLENENEQLKKQLDACMQQKEQQVQSFDASAAREAFHIKVEMDDLKIVEGIGEKIDSILKKNGIITWHQLSQTTPEKLSEILLAEGGPSYKIHDPKTWPAQALLAYEGKWKQLKEYQDQLIGGK
jgi:predicted flap endonuclease-1-like 5' DNA nuclease